MARDIDDIAPVARSWPVAFDGHAGWLHAPPAGRAASLGVVLCAPLGRDARCAHRPLRLLAETLAAAGMSVLRYDHLGVGDSLDLPDADADALPIWREGVGAAVARLKALAGVEQVVLVGLRFGATLAALAQDQADGLALLAPIVRGRTWLRELTLATAVMAPTTGGADVARGLDADGLVLNPATLAAISAVDLATVAPSKPLLVVASNPAAQTLAQATGAACVAFEGFDALFDDAHSNRSPEAVFDATRAWIGANFAEALARPAAVSAPASKAALIFPPGAVERPVVFGDGLRGVLCAPADGVVDGRTAVVFGNTGGDPRAGIGGFATASSRALARAGTLSLRVDFAGLGDSPAADDDAGSHIYETSRAADIEAARALLIEAGAGQVIVAGCCSGGYHALCAALDNPALAGAFMVNTVVLAWREGTSLAIGERDQGRSTKAYLQRAGDPRTWRRLLSGGLDVGAVARTFAIRLKERLAARAAAAPEAAVKAALTAFCARGGRIGWVVGAEDPALDTLETNFGPGGRRFAALPGARLSIVEGLDHGLALSSSRDKARDELLAFVASTDAV